MQRDNAKLHGWTWDSFTAFHLRAVRLDTAAATAIGSGEDAPRQADDRSLAREHAIQDLSTLTVSLRLHTLAIYTAISTKTLVLLSCFNCREI